MPGDDTVEVRFHPQEWVESPGKAHDREKRRLAPADDRDPVTFAVPRTDATDEEGIRFDDESYWANQLATHAVAPDWVADWDGPYYVHLVE